MENLMSFFRSVPTEPPPSRVPAVLQRREVIERELIELKLQIDERVLACVEGKPDGRRNLAELCESIRVAEFELDSLPLARKLAARLDNVAILAWQAEVQTMSPSEIIAGITKDDCCDRCNDGCVILGGDPSAHRNECAHPVRMGPLSARYADNPQVQSVFAAACSELHIGIIETRDNEDAAA
jgi:hypothetical protein